MAISGNRCTLALSKLEQFAAFAVAHYDYTREDTVGPHEVLRLRGKPRRHIPGDGARGQLLIFFVREGGHRRHASCQRKGLQLVERWIRDRGAR